MATEASPTVLVAADDPALLDEIVRFLDRIPSWRLVTCTGPAETAVNAIESNYPDATVVTEGLAAEISEGGRPLPQGTLVVVGRRGDPSVLKAAIRLGARGFVEWPAEMQNLQAIVERTWSSAPAGRTRAGQLYGVWSPKGGSGASTVAAHLAAAVAGHERACILLDLDAGHADQDAILGMDQHARTFADLLRMGAEISPAVVDEVAVVHPSGFRAILASPDPAAGGAKPADIASAVNVVRHAADFVIADLPSTACEAALAVLDQCTAGYLVLTPDLLSLRRAREALRIVRSGGAEGNRLEIILNQTGNGGVSARDAGQVLGLPVAREIKADISIYQAANRGKLSDAGRRALSKLARNMVKAAGAQAQSSQWR